MTLSLVRCLMLDTPNLSDSQIETVLRSRELLKAEYVAEVKEEKQRRKQTNESAS